MMDWMIEHTGDTCPVDPETVVQVLFCDGDVAIVKSRFLDWATKGEEWSITHYRIITPAKPPEPEMTGFIATLTDEQKAAALAYCGDDHHGPPKPEPDLITLRLECLKLVTAATPNTSRPEDLCARAEFLLGYVLNGK